MVGLAPAQRVSGAEAVRRGMGCTQTHFSSPPPARATTASARSGGPQSARSHAQSRAVAGACDEDEHGEHGEDAALPPASTMATSMRDGWDDIAQAAAELEEGRTEEALVGS